MSDIWRPSDKFLDPIVIQRSVVRVPSGGDYERGAHTRLVFMNFDRWMPPVFGSLTELVHLVGIDDSVGALRRTGSHLSQFPANEVSGPGAIGVNPAVMRVDPLDLQGRVSCRLTRLHRCNCRLSMNGN